MTWDWRPTMADPKHPRHHDEAFKRQIAQSCESGKPSREIRAESTTSRDRPRGAGSKASATAAPPGPRTTARPGGTSRSSREEARPTVGDGGGRFRTSGAGIRTKAGVIRANAARCPISARCGIPSPPHLLLDDGRRDGACGSGRRRRARGPARRPRTLRRREDQGRPGREGGVTASRRRIGSIMREQGMRARTRADGSNRTRRGSTRRGSRTCWTAGSTATPHARVRRAT